MSDLPHAADTCRISSSYVKDYSASQQKAVKWIADAARRGAKHTYSDETDDVFRAWLHERGYRTQVLNGYTLYIMWGDKKPMNWFNRMCFNM